MPNQSGSSFRKRVEVLIAQVPRGKVTTYGDLAALAGRANASRIVGGIAHFGDSSLPWHRLVNRFGGLASGYYGGRDGQAKLLEDEGTACDNGVVVDFKEKRWIP